MSAQEDAKGVQEAVRRIEEARQSDSKSLDLSGLELGAVPDSSGQLVNLQSLGSAQRKY